MIMVATNSIRLVLFFVEFNLDQSSGEDTFPLGLELGVGWGVGFPVGDKSSEFIGWADGRSWGNPDGFTRTGHIGAYNTAAGERTRQVSTGSDRAR